MAQIVIPSISMEQMIEIDRVMMEDIGISLMQMMENAGRNLAHLARQRLLSGDPAGKAVVILAGTGGNGGGALVCARHLHNWGAQVQVFTTKPREAFTLIPARQLDILCRMGIPVSPASEINRVQSTDLVIDGLIGYRLVGAPRDAVAELIRWANAQSAPILALDIPSGLDSTTGEAFDPTICASATMTLALPKHGLLALKSAPFVGELYLADISVPPELYQSQTIGIQVGLLFAKEDIIRLR
jgi:NAD(P)H-hydrate epimerase